MREGRCPPKDGKFANAILFVHGPRARRNPGPHDYCARGGPEHRTGPFNLSTAKDLALKIDGGEDLFTVDVSGETKFSQAHQLAHLGRKIRDKTAVTAREIVSWLNGNLRSRLAPSLPRQRQGCHPQQEPRQGVFGQLTLSDVNTVVFGSNTNVEMVGGFAELSE